MRKLFAGAPQYPTAAILIALVLSVYWQVGGHSYVWLDDQVYVFKNARVLRGLTPENVSWAFATFDGGNWHPLTWLSHMADVDLFGPAAGWPHRVNVLFHIVNTVLFFLVLRRMTGALWRSAAVAALFGVHPLHVESVAWVSERKDVLCALFFVLALGAYVRYAERPSAGRYLAVATLFALGFLCKPMIVTLPFVLLLLDWWPLNRAASAGQGDNGAVRSAGRAFFPLLLEKLPLLAMSAAACVVTVVAQSGEGAVVDFAGFPAGPRISNAIVAYAAYLGKTAWPASLAVFYPHPAAFPGGVPAWKVAGAIVLLGGVTFVAWRSRRRHPYLAAGWLWYLGTLVPVVGLVQVGGQAMADRYTYIPLAGVFVAAAWGVPAFFAARLPRWVAPAALVVAVAVFSTVAWRQAGYWRDGVALFSRAAAVTERNWVAWHNLGVTYDESGRTADAAECYRKALRIRPDQASSWYSLAVAYGRLGRLEDAAACLRESVRYRSDSADAWYNLGVVYGRLGRPGQAVESYRESLRIAPDSVDAWHNLGVTYGRLGRAADAAASFREVLRIDPGNAAALRSLREIDGAGRGDAGR